VQAFGSDVVVRLADSLATEVDYLDHLREDTGENRLARASQACRDVLEALRQEMRPTAPIKRN
jgi:hypothetical protein